MLRLVDGCRKLAAAAMLSLAPMLAWAGDAQIANFTDSPDPVAAGALYTYTVTVANNDPTDSVNTVLSLSVPAGATFVSASVTPSGSCAPVSATQVDCVLGTVAGGGSDTRTATLTWRAIGPGPTSIAATASVTADSDVNLGNNSQNQTTTVISGANMALTMTDSPDPVVGGGQVTYTITASNPAGPNAAAGIVVTDTLPPSTTFISASGSGWSCSHNTGVVTCTRAGPHAVGASIPAITLVVRVDATSGTVTNVAVLTPASGGVAEADASDNTATASTTVLDGADVSILQKLVTSATPAIAGTNVSFQIRPRNAGPGAAVNASVTDNLPAGWTFVSATGPNWSCTAAGSAVTCTRASLPMGAADNITVVATAPGNGVVGPTGSSYTNTAGITSATADPDAGNNSGSVNITVLPDGADLRIAKFKVPDPVALGSNLTSTITVTNNGPRSATGALRVIDVLTGESYVSFSGTGWSCSAAANVVQCDHANGGGLAVGGSLPGLQIVTTATSAGTVTNTACTGGTAGVGGYSASPPAEGDPNTSNDCVSSNAQATTIQPDLAIAKTTTTPSGGDKTVSATESSVTYTLVVTNASGSAQNATGVRITDTVPGYLTGRTSFGAFVPVVSGGSTATFSCTNTGATVNCNQTGGVLAQGETVTVPITVNRPLLDGSFTNNAYVTNATEGDPVSGNNSASDTVTIAPIADVEMTGKTVSPAAVRAGEEATYVLSYRNNGPSQAQAVQVVDTFNFPGGDAGLTVVSITSSKSGSTCSIAAGAILNPASPSFSCTIGNLADGETHSITLRVRPNYQAGNPARAWPNTAAITTTSLENTAGGDNGNNSRNATLNITAADIDLLVNTTDFLDPVPYASGTTFLDYRVRVTNNGPSYGTNVRVEEIATPPAGKRIRFVCDATAFGGSSCNASSLCSVTNVTSAPGTPLAMFTCSVPAGNATTGPGVGELAIGQSKDIFLRFEVLDLPAATGDVYNSSATVRANEPDNFAANDTEGEPTTTRQRIDIRVSKVPSLGTVTLRQPFNWVITVANNGPGNSLQTDLSDSLPAGTVVTGPVTWTRTLPVGNGTCTLAGLNLSCALGQLDGTGSATITVPVRMDSYPSGGVANNSATVDVDPTKTGAIDTPGGNNTGNGTVNVTRSSIAGTVFEDRDRAAANGGTPQAAGVDPRIAGVTLQLSGTDSYGNPVNLTTSSDASGNFSFGNLAPSDGTGYSITQSQPAGHVNGPVDPPVAGGSQPSAGGSYSRGGVSGNSGYTGIVLAAATAAVNYNFPEVRQPRLSGFVYVDANASGARDAGTDPVIAGATVRLLDAGTLAVLQTTTTDGTGAYSFTGLDPFTAYTLEQPLPTSPVGLANGPVNPGLIAGASCASGCTAQAGTPSAGIDRIAGIDLSTGADGTLFNFGEIQLTSISGTVYVDRNRNDVLDASPADGRLAGVTVRLVQGADCASGTVLQTTVTDSNGLYGFAGVAGGGNYLICQTQPVGYLNGVQNPGTNASTPGANVIAISNLPGSGSAGNHFGERVGSVAGTVYLDANHDGQQQLGENGIAAVTLTLSGTDAAGAAVNRTATTDASGNFRFDDLLQSSPAGYALTEQLAQPVVSGTATLNGRTTAGTIASVATGTASPLGVAPSTITALVLPAGADSVDNRFGEILPVRIAGIVFIDLNNNGQLDAPGDTGLAAVTITVTGTDDTGAAVNRTLSTAADGRFDAADLRPGTYTLTEPTQPTGTSNGLTVAGTAGGTATGPGTLPSRISPLALTTPGASSLDNRFAEIANSSAITGRVWLDSDNDGVIDLAETGIAGQTINLSGTDSGGAPVNRSTVTDATGQFSFAGLAPGSYTLTQPAQPAGTVNGRTLPGTGGGTASAVGTLPSTVGGIALAVGMTAADNLFGEVPAAQVSGRVWLDNNDNGAVEPAEAGLAGVNVVLSGTDDLGNPVSLSTATAADGSFGFTGLRPGSYALTEPGQPAGTVNGQTVAGTLGGTATAPATVPSAITGIALPPGGHAANNLFGEIAESPDLRVAKSHAPAVFTVTQTARYTIVVRNAGNLPTTGSYTVDDRLPAGLTLAATPSGSGWTCTGAVGDSAFSCTSGSVIAAGASGAQPIQVVVRVGAAAAAASPVSNAVLVDGGGEVDARRPTSAERAAFATAPGGLPVCDPAAAHNACRDPAPVQLAASISGTVWTESGPVARVLDAGDRRMAGWLVELVDPASGTIVARAATGADGRYRIVDLVPGVAYTVRFRDPASNVVWGYPVNGETAPGSSGAVCVNGTPAAGTASSCVGTGANPQLTVVLAPGADLPQQSLPIDPSGVVYDSGLRTPVPGSTVTLSPAGACAGWSPATSVVAAMLGGYAITGDAISMTVGPDGFYQFLFAPAAPASCNFSLGVVPPAGYTFVSAAIPPSTGPLVPVGGPGSTFAVQPQADAPTGAIGTATGYYLLITGGSAGANILHNHIPVDPALPNGISLSKTGDKSAAEIGDSVRYTLTVVLQGGARPRQTTVVDRLPAGFTYIRGSASVDDVPIADPAGGSGPTLAFQLGSMPASNRLVLRYRVRIGVGASQGDGINRAQAHACGAPGGCVSAGFSALAGSVATNTAQFRVRVGGGVFGTDACVLGKVFVDCNHNQVQDREELGVPGVRLMLSDLTLLVSDSEGKFSLCGLPPRSHVLKVDGTTLPRGSRLVSSSNRNLGDADSLWLDLKNGELHRADFIEGSCSNTVLEQVKARRAQGEVRAPEVEKKGGSVLRFDNKAHQLDTLRSPQQGTDGANQTVPRARPTEPKAEGPTADETRVPTPELPMNRPPPRGRDPGDAPGSTASPQAPAASASGASTNGASNGTR